MNYFWCNVFEYFKDRRFGAAFFSTSIIVFVVLCLVAIFYRFLEEEWPIILLAVSAMFLLLLWRAFRRMRARARDRYKISPLSRDELRKARSKLVRAKH